MEEPSKFASFSPTIRRVISRRVLLAALMAIVCVLLVNLLALRNPAKFALAQSADHSLSPLTKKVLGSLTNDVRVVALFDTQSDLFEPVRNLLVEYERASKEALAAEEPCERRRRARARGLPRPPRRRLDEAHDDVLRRSDAQDVGDVPPDPLRDAGRGRVRRRAAGRARLLAVSYTHLTLPTKRIV